MAVKQPILSNGNNNGFVTTEKASIVNGDQYATSSETGLDGPDQILHSNLDTTWEPDGCIRIKLAAEGRNAFPPISVPGLLMKTAREHPNHPALVSRPGVDDRRITLTYKEYETQVRIVAKAFLKLGLQRFHSVCILGANSPQWFISDIAAIYAGGFAAGIYPTNSPKACQHCAETSRANIILVEDENQLEKITSIKKNLPLLKAIIQYDGEPKDKDVLSWNNLLEIGKGESDEKLDAILKTIAINQCCTLVYTSGTIGHPKAVMLSHDNILHGSRVFSNSIDYDVGNEVIVSYLPLSHIAAQVFEIFLSISMAGTVYFADKNALKGSIVKTLTEVRPTMFLGVPRIWEKIYEKMQIVTSNGGVMKTWLTHWAKAQGLMYHTNRMNGIDYKHWGYVLAKSMVFKKVKAALGLDKCKLLISGAAPISAEIKKYFLSLDIRIIDAYGMSETSGPHSISVTKHYRPGSAGLVTSDFPTKLYNSDDSGEGEICMKGRQVFMGYLRASEKTKEAKDDEGWLHSGDLGKIDSNGFLYVTGRIKELIVTAGGENIPPVHIEHMLLTELPALSNAILIGDLRKYLTILVTFKSDVNADTGEPLDTLIEEARAWVKSVGSKATTVSEILETQDPLIYKGIEEAIKIVNMRAISNAQKIQKFRILPHDLSVATGELGPTLKIKRNVVCKMYANLIDEMYK